MIFPSDIMARLTAMFHAAFCESKLLAQSGCQTLTLNPVARWHERVRSHVRALGPVSAFPLQTSVSAVSLFTCFFFYVFLCSQITALAHDAVGPQKNHNALSRGKRQ